MSEHSINGGRPSYEWEGINQEEYAVAREHLQKEGWVVIPDVLTSEQADDVLIRLWKAKEAGEKQGNPTYLEWLDPNPSNVRIFFLLELDRVFRQLISHPVAIDMVKSVLGI
jgi:fumagillin biosynthesis dioxygenase